MKIMQSTVERSLYLLVLIIFLTNSVGLVIQSKTNEQVKQILSDHTQIIERQERQTKTIEDNQLTNSHALKDYIACLLVLNPQGNLQAQEQTCFDDAPQVK